MKGTEAHTLDQIVDADRETLSAQWPTLIGGSPPKRISTPLMRRCLADAAQSASGDTLPKRIEAKLISIGKDQSRPLAPRLQPGSQLVREWNGVTHKVDVLKKGFEWKGGRYRSLSAIAHAITGTRWSGPRFFGLDRKARP